MTLVARRKPLEVNPEIAVLLCGKRTAIGRWTCGGAFAELLELPGPEPREQQIWVYAIFKEVRPGVFDLNDHAKKQRAAGRAPTLRRRRLRSSGDATRPLVAARPPTQDLGALGEEGGTFVRAGPITVHCPRCREPNIVPAAWFQ